MDGARTEVKQHDTRNQGRDVTVDDGRVGVLVTVVHRHAQALARTQLFLDTFVDDDVGIHGHTEREHDTRNTGQRQHRAQRGQHAEHKEQVDQQRDIGNQTALVVENQHVNQYHNEGQDERQHTVADGFLTQGRPYDRLLYDRGGGGQFTRFEDIGQVLAFFYGKAARNGRTAAGDFAVDGRPRIGRVIHDDGDGTAHVVTRHVFPDARAFGVHRHADFHAARLVVVLTRVGDGVATQRGAAVTRRHFQRDERVNIGIRLNRFDRPYEFGIARELSLAECQQLIHALHVFGHRVTYDRASAVLVTLVERRNQNREQRVFGPPGFAVELFGVVGVAGRQFVEQRVFGSVRRKFFRQFGQIVGFAVGKRGLGRRRFGDGRDGALRLFVGLNLFYRSQVFIGRLQGRREFRKFIGFPKFQLGRTLEQFAHTFRFLYARQLNQDTFGGAEFLNVGLRHAEFVDTLTQDLIRAVERPFGFFPDGRDNGAVGRVGVHRFHFEAEDGSHLRVRVHFVPHRFEDADEVAVRFNAVAFDGRRHNAVEQRVGAVAGKGSYDIGRRNLHQYVHTAPQVKPEVQFTRLTLLISVFANQNVVDDFVAYGILKIFLAVAGNGIQIVLLFQRIAHRQGFGLRHRFRRRGVNHGLFVHPPREERKRKLIKANNRKRPCEEFNNSLILHNLNN